VKIQYMSDLHIDKSVRQIVRTGTVEGDVLVVAGDLAEGIEPVAEFLEKLTRFGVPVLFVPGNHEFFGCSRSSYFRELRTKMPSGATLMDRSERVISGIRFLGCTLWTDFGRESDMAMGICSLIMPDFNNITDDSGELISPSDQLAWHKAERQWLSERLASPFEGPTVVVTHHSPSYRSTQPIFSGSPLLPAFCSNLEAMIEAHSPELWIHGHVHGSFDYRIGRTRIVCNPRGYPDDESRPENPDWRFEKVVFLPESS